MIQVQLKLRPTKAQERTFVRWLHHLTGVWNWSVRKLEADRRLTAYALQAQLNGHGRKMGMPGDAIDGTVKTAHLAARRAAKGVAGRPRLKGLRRPLSSIAFNHWAGPRIRGGRASLPGMGPVRFCRQDIPDGRVGSARIVRRASGWYLCLFIQSHPQPVGHVSDGEVGIDPGFSTLLTLSTGEKVEHPHEWASSESRLGQAQRGSRKRLVARLQERIGNQRKDRNHKLSRRLVAENRLIAFSSDQHSNIARRFGKSVASAGHHQLRQMLSYKSRTGGREYVEVGSRNSTRTCSVCGALTGPTGWRGLSVRQWTCSACGAHLDRDVNAAENTLIAGRGARLKSRREATPGTAAKARPQRSYGPTPRPAVEM